MRPSKDHYVTACQQLLALGAVLAVLTPAASIISLDVVHQAPASQSPGGITAGSGHALELTAYTREARRTSRVPTAPVDAELTEYALTGEPGLRADAPGRRQVASRTIADADGTSLSVLSRPAPAVGCGGVGVTGPRVPRRARPRPRLSGGPPGPAGHRRAVRRPRGRRPGPRRRPGHLPAGRDADGGHRPGPGHRDRAGGSGHRHR